MLRNKLLCSPKLTMLHTLVALFFILWDKWQKWEGGMGRKDAQIHTHKLKVSIYWASRKFQTLLCKQELTTKFLEWGWSIQGGEAMSCSISELQMTGYLIIQRKHGLTGLVCMHSEQSTLGSLRIEKTYTYYVLLLVSVSYLYASLLSKHKALEAVNNYWIKTQRYPKI